MRDDLRERLDELARRAGLSGVSPAVLWAALAVLGLAVGIGVWRWMPSGAGEASAIAGAAEESVLSATPSSSSASGSAAPGAAASATASAAAPLWVHVVGAVRHPGLYRLDDGSRVDAAVEAAGGFLGNAAPEGVNLARPLADGEQLIVPTAEEYAKSGAQGAAGGTAASGGGAGGAAGAAPGAPVDINSATAEQLDTLPGVGPATATKIVADREANGRFASPDDLGRVAGIGPKKLEDLRALIVAR